MFDSNDVTAEIVTEADNWDCYRLEPGYVPGHLMFVAKGSDPTSLIFCYKAAERYGKVLVDVGWGKNYLLIGNEHSAHVAPLNQNENMVDFLEFINSKYSKNEHFLSK
jgi:hypothetical protein